MTLLFPGPAYRIRTRRLVVRCWEPADAPLLLASIIESLDHLRPWMPWAAQPPQGVQAELDLIRRWRGLYDLGQDFVHGIFNPEETQVWGGTGLHTRIGEFAREIGYWIHKDHINQGLATEVAAALTKVAFEVDGVQRVEIHCDPANLRSAAVPRKLGYTHDGTLRKRLFDTDGALRDSMIWSLFQGEYPATPSAQAEIEAFDALGRRLI